MVLYHIALDGRPAKCRAKKRTCPRGEHFATQEDAQKYADETNPKIVQSHTKKFKQLTTNTLESELKNPNSKTSKIYNLAQRKATGFNYEVFMSNNYAMKQGLNNVMIRTEESKWNLSAFGGGISKEEAQTLYKKARRAFKDAYGPDADPKTAIKIIYFDKENLNRMFIQTTGSDTIDGLSVTENDFRLIEIKRTHKGGAQMEEYMLGVGSNGNYNISDSRLTDEVYYAVNSHNTYVNDKDSDFLKISNFECLRQFARDYKTRGTDEFVFTDKEGKPYVIDMTKDEDEVVKDLAEAGIMARIKIRTNASTVKMDKHSKNRLMLNKNNLYSGEIIDNKIKVSQINTDKIKYTQKRKRTNGKNSYTDYIRFGEFKTKYTKEEWAKLPGDHEISIDELEYFRPILSGDIKIRPEAKPISRL